MPTRELRIAARRADLLNEDVAEIVFDDNELSRIDRICAECDPAVHDLTAGHIAALRREEDRTHVLGHMRRALRAELVIGLVARAAAEACRSQAEVEPIATRQFVDDDFEKARSGLTGARRLREGRRWQYNLGYLSNEAISTYRILRKEYGSGPKDDGLYPVDEAFFGLLDVAHDRMFDSLEREHERLLRIEGSVAGESDD